MWAVFLSLSHFFIFYFVLKLDDKWDDKLINKVARALEVFPSDIWIKWTQSNQKYPEIADNENNDNNQNWPLHITAGPTCQDKY